MSMTPRPLVSVITPVYNGEAYLAECIESVLRQTYSDWEYIILNNDSKDRTLEIAEHYRSLDSRIRVHSNSTLLPIIDNHNRAFRLISADSAYCKVVSADDWLLPECLERMVTLAEANPSVGIVGAYQLAGGGGVSYVRNIGLPCSETVVSGRAICRAQLLGVLRILGNPTSVLYRADLVRGVDSFFPNASAEADTSACIMHLRHSNFGFVHQVLSHERIHDSRMTTYSLSTNAYLSAAISDCQTYGGWYLSESELAARIEDLLAEYYAYLARSALKYPNRKFWDIHIQRLDALGFRLDKMRLSGAVGLQLLDLLLNPKNTLQNALRRVRLNRAISNAS